MKNVSSKGRKYAIAIGIFVLAIAAILVIDGTEDVPNREAAGTQKICESSVVSTSPTEQMLTFVPFFALITAAGPTTYTEGEWVTPYAKIPFRPVTQTVKLQPQPVTQTVKPQYRPAMQPRIMQFQRFGK
jgi:hypothetical protein